jgi:putative transposase
MPRKQRTISVGLPHHITQRGVLRVNIFEEKRDYEIYKELLRKEQLRYGLRIWAYCLMTNHVHLIAVPDDMISLSLTIKNVHSNYARYFNSKKGRNGHLMQERFYSCPVPTEHAATAIRYVERNPLAACMVDRCEDYLWSSARANAGLIIDDIIDQSFNQHDISENWLEWINGSTEREVEISKQMRSATQRGSWH